MPGKIPAHIRKNDMNFSKFRKLNKEKSVKTVKTDAHRTNVYQRYKIMCEGPNEAAKNVRFSPPG